MRIHLFQHVGYRDRAFLPEWAEAAGHQLTRVLVPETERLPKPEEIDALIVIGGPMSIWDDQNHPWLAPEKQLVAELLQQDKPVLGICLGAQMIAEYLGARVKTGDDLEIGWFDLETTPESRTTWLADTLPDRFETFFWHGDVFELPAGAVRIGGTPANPNQGFIHGRSIALQFHLEVTPQWAHHLAARDGDQLTPAPYVQDAATLLSRPNELYRENNVLMARLLERWLGAG